MLPLSNAFINVSFNVLKRKHTHYKLYNIMNVVNFLYFNRHFHLKVFQITSKQHMDEQRMNPSDVKMINCLFPSMVNQLHSVKYKGLQENSVIT